MKKHPRCSSCGRFLATSGFATVPNECWGDDGKERGHCTQATIDALLAEIETLQAQLADMRARGVS